MSKPPSLETQLRNARRENAELRKQLSREKINASIHQRNVVLAREEANDWKRRFDQLMARDMKTNEAPK